MVVLPESTETASSVPHALAIVVLGCRLRFDRTVLRGPAVRRAARAAEVYFGRPSAAVIVVSGGRAWEGVVEADALASELVRLGVPASRIVRERCSHSTRENARYVAELLARRGVTDVELVTCAFHLPRAQLLFEHAGFTVRAHAAAPPSEQPSRFRRLVTWARERGAFHLDRRFVRGAAAR